MARKHYLRKHEEETLTRAGLKNVQYKNIGNASPGVTGQI